MRDVRGPGRSDESRLCEKFRERVKLPKIWGARKVVKVEGAIPRVCCILLVTCTKVVLSVCDGQF